MVNECFWDVTGRRPGQIAKRRGAGEVAGGVKFVASLPWRAGGGASSFCRCAGIISSEPWEARRAALSGGGGGGKCAVEAPCMLRLHYYSDNPALVAGDEEESVYSIELIKEFEAVGRAWKAFLADWLLKGAGIVYVTHVSCYRWCFHFALVLCPDTCRLVYVPRRELNRVSQSYIDLYGHQCLQYSLHNTQVEQMALGNIRVLVSFSQSCFEYQVLFCVLTLILVYIIIWDV